MKKKERCCFVSPYSIHILFHCLASGFCLNVLNQNLEILKSVNFQYAHCVHSCISVVIVIYLLFSLTFNRFFSFQVFFGLRFYFQTRIYLSNKVVIKQHFRFCFIWTKNQPKELFGSQFHVRWCVCVCTSFRASCFFFFINTINLNPPVCNISPLFFFVMKFKIFHLFNQIICNLFTFYRIEYAHSYGWADRTYRIIHRLMQ